MWRSEVTFRSWFFPFTVWDPEMGLRSSGPTVNMLAPHKFYSCIQCLLNGFRHTILQQYMCMSTDSLYFINPKHLWSSDGTLSILVILLFSSIPVFLNALDQPFLINFNIIFFQLCCFQVNALEILFCSQFSSPSKIKKSSENNL